ncbi:MAG: TRCF domain-containing protein, partial [Thermodesulfobacteriota bacterium]|nr:TRCF domain-containing protein [Thermodesulfobacteriota bacterium]
IRGAGNLLGVAQSGQINAVGYEMYVQLIDKAVREMKGEEHVEEVDPEVALGLPAYIPESYVPDMEQRLVHYRRFSSIRDAADLEDLTVELHDRYGPPPIEVENLLAVMELKHWLRQAGVKRLEMGRGGLTFSFAEQGRVKPDKVLALAAKYPDQAKLSPQGRLFIALAGMEGRQGLNQAKNILQELI